MASKYFLCRHRIYQSLICKYLFKVKLVMSEWNTTRPKSSTYQVCAIQVKKFLPLAEVFRFVLHLPCHGHCCSRDLNLIQKVQLFSTFHIFQSPLKNSRDLELQNFLWREFIVQGWYFLFLNMSSTLGVFFQQLFSWSICNRWLLAK